MKTSVDVLVGLIVLKELEIKTLKERIARLQQEVASLEQENSALYAVVNKQNHEIGYKQGGKDENR